MRQLHEVVIPLFNLLHPGAQALFMFDNSANHHARHPQGLCAENHNLSDGGKHAKVSLRPGFYVKDGAEVEHNLYLPDGTLKGLKTLLRERDLWPKDGLKLEEARELLANQPDFRAQHAWMAEVVEQAGHLIDFYPKFHCELNPIERAWGAAKRWTRENCEYTFPSLQKLVPQSLARIPLESFKRYFRGAWRYMTAYQAFDGVRLSAKQALWAQKKYSSHRCIPESILKELEENNISSEY